MRDCVSGMSFWRILQKCVEIVLCSGVSAGAFQCSRNFIEYGCVIALIMPLCKHLWWPLYGVFIFIIHVCASKRFLVCCYYFKTVLKVWIFWKLFLFRNTLVLTIRVYVILLCQFSRNGGNDKAFHYTTISFFRCL